MRSLEGRRVLVMGLGLFGGGVGAARYLQREGAEVTVTDLRTAETLSESIRALEGVPVRYRLGGHDENDFTQADLVVANPAVPRSSPFLQVAESLGIPVTTEICLFLERCPCRVVGVTGSSGKTTTTCLLGEMLQRADPRALVGGNVGGSLLDRLDELTSDTPVVLELSSFQLDRLGDAEWSPQIAVVTNFAPNHLDVHGSLEAYRTAKQQIVVHQGEGDYAVLNGDDAEVVGWEGLGRGECVSFSVQGGQTPGAYLRDGEVRHTIGGSEATVCPASDLSLPGRHNLANALAACGAALSWGVGESDVAAAIRDFSGVEHRLEYVGVVGGVTYYNDSIATSPDRTRVALESLPEGVILIAGGSDKGLSFGELGPLIGRRTRDLVVLGETAEAIASAVPHGSETGIHRADSLEDAVAAATRLARPGGTVVLSPASASYDMFRNFGERGHAFKRLVAEL
ncbi:MAG: UDP-N-acetylmuramoyl-L-alanine--D-glutamate ligase, partial [Candidatus Latescibacteria bacterium]|nr:UDP-N-acetylmuramoyl-L-alanine--D-glutamate ligase [Candidatus Latescibacterota bacterium]